MQKDNCKLSKVVPVVVMMKTHHRNKRCQKLSKLSDKYNLVYSYTMKTNY